MKRSLLVYAGLGLALALGVPYFLWGKKANPAISPLPEQELRKNVDGKNILIVGGTKGIGHALAASLSKRGAKVVVTGRSAPEDILSSVEFVKNDVGTLKGSHQLVPELLKRRTFDTVVFTVGIITSPKIQRNEEGIERDLATSYLSRFIIANDLIKANAITGRKRVFVMGYPGEDLTPTNMDDINFEKTEYSAIPAHMNTVIFNEAFVFELAKRHPELHVFGLNPGLIQTGIRDNYHGGNASFLGKAIETLIGLTQQTAEHYSEAVLMPLMASPELDSKTALNFANDGSLTKTSKWMSDPANRDKVWGESEKLVAKVLAQ